MKRGDEKRTVGLEEGGIEDGAFFVCSAGLLAMVFAALVLREKAQRYQSAIVVAVAALVTEGATLARPPRIEAVRRFLRCGFILGAIG